MTKINFLSILTIILLTITGCSNSTNNSSESFDPFEGVNRNFFTFNKYLDKEVVEPLSKTYVKVVPNTARKGVSNHLKWIKIPTTIFNSTIQMDIENTILSTAKFLLNGLTLGFYDLDENETKINDKDFGSTLAKLKVPEGPFLMVPFFGPKIARDLTGTIVDRQYIANISSDTIDDINLVEVPIRIIDDRRKMSKTIGSIYNSSDPYIKMRSYYMQNRRNKVYTKKYKEMKNNDKDLEFEKLLQ